MADPSPAANESDRIFALPSAAAGGGARFVDRRRATSEAPVDAAVGRSALVAAANPLLNLLYQIRTLAYNTNPEALKDYLVQEVREFESRARYRGVSTEHVMAARYCLCTALDEAAAYTPWGGSGVWSRKSLLVIFHNETWGGEKFFQLLAKLEQSPVQHIDLIELMYYCMALGFQGRFRVVTDGRSELEALRRRTARVIETVRGVPDKPLSLHWRGTVLPRPRLWRVVPIWVTGALAALAAIAFFALLSFWLAGRSDRTFLAISGLQIPELAPPVPAAPAPKRFTQFLEPEIREGLVSVDERADRSTVTILGDGLFRSGGATIRPEYDGVLHRITQAISMVEGNVLITGHTDSVPIHTLRFPSNWELSHERARLVAERIRNGLPPTRLIGSEGRAAGEPVADNATAEGRAQNRRVEITVFASPDQLRTEVEP